MTLSTHATSLPPLLDPVERIEAEAFADLFTGAPPAVRKSLGLHVLCERGAVAVVASGVDHLLFNRVMGLRVQGPHGSGAMERIVAHYGAEGVSRFFVHVPREASFEPLRDELTSLGLARYRRAWLKLVRFAPSVPVPSRAVVEVVPVSESLAEEAGVLVARGFDLPEAAGAVFSGAVGRPRWHVYAAMDARRVVGVAGLFVHRGIGSLAFAVTADGMRQRGVQTALIERRIRVAHALGLRMLVSETGEPVPGDPQHSERNLRRAGLVPLYLRDNWAPVGVAW